jgi:hypothetical protein
MAEVMSGPDGDGVDEFVAGTTAQAIPPMKDTWGVSHSVKMVFSTIPWPSSTPLLASVAKKPAKSSMQDSQCTQQNREYSPDLTKL